MEIMLTKTEPKILKLPPLLINQIAAGEVVERPASVVKELLENSLDAGSTQIEITIEKGGVGLIRIRDNGSGIAKTDLPLAISSHATSKIKTFADLECVASLGFRGEALASISAVSRFSLTSCMEGQSSGWMISLDGKTEQPILKPASHPKGTTIEVRDLFFNTPARRKFLRAEKTELTHIENIVRRIALSHFEVKFILKHQDKVILNIPAAKNREAYLGRVAKVCGTAFVKQAMSVDIERTNLRLWGWVGLPSFSRSQNDLQYFYINGRLVKDKLITHALRQAYQDLIYQGRQPAYVLYLELDPTSIDVNVHPTKQEVRFRESRLVHDFLVHSLEQALADEPSITETESPVAYQTQQPSVPQVQEQIAAYKTLQTPSETKPFLGYAIGEMHNEYILAENEIGLVIVAIKPAQQLICKKRLTAEFAENKITIRPLLLPKTINLTAAKVNLLEQHQALLHSVGLIIDRFNEDKIIVRQLPVVLTDVALEPLIQAIVNTPDVFTAEKLIKQMAQHSASEPQQPMPIAAMNQLLRQLENVVAAQQQEVKGVYKILEKQSLLRSQ